MELKKHLNTEFIKILGPCFLVISEFLPWFSNLSLFQIYLLTTYVELQNAFLYLFPLISGIISLFGFGLYLKNKEERIKYTVISLIGVGFLLIFFIELIPSEELYLQNIDIGFYLCGVGLILQILSLVHTLIIKSN